MTGNSGLLSIPIRATVSRVGIPCRVCAGRMASPECPCARQHGSGSATTPAPIARPSRRVSDAGRRDLSLRPPVTVPRRLGCGAVASVFCSRLQIGDAPGFLPLHTSTLRRAQRPEPRRALARAPSNGYLGARSADALGVQTPLPS